MNEASKIRQTIAQEFADKLQDLDRSPARAFILYGSTVLGTANDKSDIDLMLLVDYHDRNLNAVLRDLTNTLEKESGIQITTNIKLVSDFLKEITEGNHYFLHIALKGTCLFKSKVFDGFKSIVSTDSLPSHKELVRKNANDTHARVQNLFLGSLVKFCTGVRITILKYLDLKLLENMELNNWEDYQNKIQREAYEPSIRKYLPDYADNVLAFFKLSDQVKPLGFDLDVLDALPPCKFIALLDCIEYIQKDSKAFLQE